MGLAGQLCPCNWEGPCFNPQEERVLCGAFPLPFFCCVGTEPGRASHVLGKASADFSFRDNRVSSVGSSFLLFM